jgi:hypothetical protein
MPVNSRAQLAALATVAASPIVERIADPNRVATTNVITPELILRGSRRGPSMSSERQSSEGRLSITLQWVRSAHHEFSE